MKKQTKPHIFGWRLIGVFLVFASVMATLAATALSLPDTVFSRTFWSLRPEVHMQLSSLGKPVIFGFFALGGVAVAIAFFWWRKRRIGWLLAVVGLAVNITGDIGQIFMGRIFEGSAGVILGGIFLSYLFSAGIRRVFESDR